MKPSRHEPGRLVSRPRRPRSFQLGLACRHTSDPCNYSTSQRLAWAHRRAAGRCATHQLRPDRYRCIWTPLETTRTNPYNRGLRAGGCLGAPQRRASLASVCRSSGNLSVNRSASTWVTAGFVCVNGRDGRVRRGDHPICSTTRPPQLLGDRGRESGLRRRAAIAGKPPASETRNQRLRRTISGMPPRCFRTTATAWAARAHRRDRGGRRLTTAGSHHWRKPLPATDIPIRPGSSCRGAAIGRLGRRSDIRRRPADPRSGQRTALGPPHPVISPTTSPNTTPRRRGSTGPTDTPHLEERCRSTEKHPPPRPTPFGPPGVSLFSIIRNVFSNRLRASSAHSESTSSSWSPATSAPTS